MLTYKFAFEVWYFIAGHMYVHNLNTGTIAGWSDPACVYQDLDTGVVWGDLLGEQDGKCKRRTSMGSTLVARCDPRVGCFPDDDSNTWIDEINEKLWLKR